MSKKLGTIVGFTPDAARSPVEMYQADEFSLREGGTTYDVTLHFNTEGNQSILRQFKDMILSDTHRVDSTH